VEIDKLRRTRDSLFSGRKEKLKVSGGVRGVIEGSEEELGGGAAAIEAQISCNR
jgi:hypothetical protein